MEQVNLVSSLGHEAQGWYGPIEQGKAAIATLNERWVVGSQISGGRGEAGARKLRRRRFFEYKSNIPLSWSLFLGLLAWALLFGLWEFAVYRQWAIEILLPGPERVISALVTLFAEKDFLTDVGVSVARVLSSFVLACLVAVPLGILMGSFRSVEAFFNPLVSVWRASGRR